MQTYSFGLVVSGYHFADDDVIDRLYEAGVEDASFAVRDGSSIAYFDKEADSYPAAVAEAIRELETALPNLRVVGIHVEDMLTPSGVAAISRKSRQNVHQHIQGVRGAGFPPPVTWVDQDRPLWLRGDVQVWSGVANSSHDDCDVLWPSVASGVFHLARASSFQCSHERESAFEPAIDMLLERFLALSAVGTVDRRRLAAHLRDLAQAIEESADTPPAEAGMSSWWDTGHLAT